MRRRPTPLQNDPASAHRVDSDWFPAHTHAAQPACMAHSVCGSRASSSGYCTCPSSLRSLKNQQSSSASLFVELDVGLWFALGAVVDEREALAAVRRHPVRVAALYLRQALGSLGACTRTEIGHARMTYLPGECSYLQTTRGGGAGTSRGTECLFQ